MTARKNRRRHGVPWGIMPPPASHTAGNQTLTDGGSAGEARNLLNKRPQGLGQLEPTDADVGAVAQSSSKVVEMPSASVRSAYASIRPGLQRDRQRRRPGRVRVAMP